MHRPLASRLRTLPLLGGLGAIAMIAACAPWDLGDDPDLPGMGPDSVVISAKPPPAISGGTLLVSKDNKIAVASDPDRDRVWVVNLDLQARIAEIPLQDGDEPGRVVEDGAGRFHVALRRGGAIVTLDVAGGRVADRRAVCPAPRGLAYDATADALHVACVGGELVTLPAAGGAPTRTLRLARDLRDVVVDGDVLRVSRFRSAQVLTVLADGTVEGAPMTLPTFQLFGQAFEPSVAWRMIGLPTGGIAMVHQRAMTTPVEIEEDDGYGSGGCDGSIVHGAVSTLLSGWESSLPAAAMSFAVLPVDLAVNAAGDRFAVISAGTGEVLLTNPWLIAGTDFSGEGTCNDPERRAPIDGEPTAVAFAGDRVIVQSREPAAIVILDGATITLGGESRADTGHQLFHSNRDGASALTCSSCHPEGRDDGRVWSFNPIGERRTQFIGGGILGTAPFHWDGDMSGIDAIMGEVFEHRMGGVHQSPRRVHAFARWIDTLPALPVTPPADAAAVARGQALFNDETVACATCHSGAALTDNRTVDVGTGKAFQVPSLVGIANRGPFMHNGCAATLRDRFDPACGGGDLHGKTSQLSSTQLDDLVAYLESL